MKPQFTVEEIRKMLSENRTAILSKPYLVKIIQFLLDKVEEFKAINLKAKDVLERTLDIEASACVARNRLEIKNKDLELRFQAARNLIIRDFRDFGDEDKKIADKEIETEFQRLKAENH